jgi:DNA-binding XRE family transcriptional regulator
MAGELIVACEWPAFGISETEVTLDTEEMTWRGVPVLGSDGTVDGDRDAVREWLVARARRRRVPIVPPQPSPDGFTPAMIADAVRRARRAAGVAVAELADRLQVTEKEVRAIEAGDVSLELVELARIASALGTGLDIYADGMRPSDDPYD